MIFLGNAEQKYAKQCYWMLLLFLFVKIEQISLLTSFSFYF